VGGLVVVLSLLTFWLDGIDKKKAPTGEWRAMENTLHLLELGGGWPGAFVAQRLLPRKSAKASFQFTYWLVVLLHQYIAVDRLLEWRIWNSAMEWFDKIG